MSTDFVLSRSFSAPLDRVWKAITDPAELAQWWGPAGFTWLKGTLELRPGGAFVYGMKAPNDGPEMWGKFVYEEVAAPSKLVFISSFANAAGETMPPPFPGWPTEIYNIWTLEESGGVTTLSLRGRPFNATEAERNTFESSFSNMQQGFGGTFDQLAAFLASPRQYGPNPHHQGEHHVSQLTPRLRRHLR